VNDQDGAIVGLSATPNAAAQDLGAMLSASSAPAAASQNTASGGDSFGNILSGRMSQDAASNNTDAANRSTNAAKKNTAGANAGNADANQGTKQADHAGTAAAATPATGTATSCQVPTPVAVTSMRWTSGASSNSTCARATR